MSHVTYSISGGAVMHTAGLFFAYLCLASLVVSIVFLVFVTAASMWGEMDARLFMFRRQLLLCRRIRVEHGKTWGEAWQDAGLVRRHTLLILAELQAENRGLTVDQVAFRNEVELDLWQIPMVEEVA